jgi:GTPase SAR1 family protein
MEIDGVQIKSLAESDRRFSLLLWGLAGCGKTTLAASSPGNKLLINFDPDGPVSLGSRDDVVVCDLSGERFSVVDKFKDDDPTLPLGDKQFKLSKIIEALNIETVIVDSCTAYSQLAVEKGISVTNGATLERPSPGAYGARNAITLRMMSGLLRTTKRSDTNIIFITHEDDSGVKDKEGNILHITMLLGGKLGQQVALQISEVWFMSDDGKSRKLLLRPGRMRKPMKSRMFNTTSTIEFTLKYDGDPDTNKDYPYGTHSLASFVEEWKANGFNKIQVPK